MLLQLSCGPPTATKSRKKGDDYIEMVHAALEPLHPAIHATSSSLVEFLPALKHIPCMSNTYLNSLHLRVA